MQSGAASNSDRSRARAGLHSVWRGCCLLLGITLIATAVAVCPQQHAIAEPDIGAPPGVCPATVPIPYPAIHVYCVRTSEHATISVEPTDLSDGTQLTLTLGLITPECSSYVPSRTYPCVSSIRWDAVSNYAGPAYRLVLPGGTLFRQVTPTVKDYYQPFAYDHPTFGSCIGGTPAPSSAPTCTVVIRHVPGVGPMVPSWLVFMPAIEVELGPTSHQRVYVESLARLHADNEPSPLTADFTVTPFGPGEFQFAPIVSGGVAPYRYLWDYGNGDADEGVVGGVLYDEPGAHDVTLTVIDGAGSQVTTTKQVVVEPPRLLVGIEFVDQSDAHFAVGDGFTVRLSVHADGGLGGLTDVRFGAQLAVVPADSLELVAAPPDLPIASGIALANGEVKSYDYRVRARRGGSFRLVATATAVDAAGKPLPESRVEEAGVVDALSITISFQTNPVQLELPPVADSDGDGRIDGDLNGDGVPDEPLFTPRTVTGTITVTNTSSDPITGIAFQGTQLGLDLRSVVPAQALVPFPIVVKTGPAPIERLEPGAGLDRTFTLEVSNGDLYEIRAAVLGASGTANVAGFGSGELQVLTDVKLSVDLRVSPINGRPPRVEAGAVYAITGTATNLSTTDTIEVAPILARIAGNARVLGVTEAAASGPAADICTCQTFAPTLGPQGSESDHADFTIWVATTKGTVASADVERSWVRLFPLAANRLTQDGPQPLGASEIRVDLGNGRTVLQGLDGQPWLQTLVEDPLPQARVVDWDTFVDYFLGSISENVVLGARDAGIGVLQLAGLLLSLTPTVLRAEFETVSGLALGRQLMALARYGLDTWKALPADQKQLFIQEVVADGKQRLADAKQQGAQLEAAVTHEIDKFFDDIEAWFANLDSQLDSGDMVQVALILGEPARPITQAVVEDIAGEAGFKYMCKLFKAGSKLAEPLRAAEQADELAEAARVERATEAQASAGDPRAVEQVPEMRDLPPNDRFSPAQAGRGYGVDQVSDHNLRELTQRVPIMVAVRARAAETLEWLKSAIGATLKPEGLYQRNVNELDRFLGYRTGAPGYGGGDIGSLVLAEPIPIEELERRLASSTLSDTEAAAVRARWKERYEEWFGTFDANGQLVARRSGHASLMDELRTIANRPIIDPPGVAGLEGEFMVPKDGTINWGPNFDLAGKQNQMTMRRIQLRKVADPPDAGLFEHGRQYYEVWLEDTDGLLKRVVGDIDVMGVWSMSGNVLPKPMAQQVAQLLTQLTGLQHGWSWTYLARSKELQRVLWNANPAKRGEGMLLYVRGEARQVWLRQATSAEIPVQFVDIEGAPILFDELKTNVPLGEINGIDIKQLPMPQGYVAPADSLRFAKHIDAGPGVPPHAQIVTSTAPDAAALRLGAGNELEQWNPNTGWRPSGLDEEVAIGSRHVLAVLPQTGVSEPTPAGAQEVAVFDQTGFAVGQTVVFDPGGPHQEEAVVVGFGSLLLDRPLGFAHDPGEMVTVKPLPATLPKTGGAHAPATGTVAGTLLAAGLTLAVLAGRRRRSARVA